MFSDQINVLKNGWLFSRPKCTPSKQNHVTLWGKFECNSVTIFTKVHNRTSTLNPQCNKCSYIEETYQIYLSNVLQWTKKIFSFEFGVPFRRVFLDRIADAVRAVVVCSSNARTWKPSNSMCQIIPRRWNIASRQAALRKRHFVVCWINTNM